MTAPQEPLKRTLEEFIKDATARYPDGGVVWLDNPGIYPNKVWFVTDDMDDLYTVSQGAVTDYARRWEDAAEQFYGRPVVARDEAAELREENKRLSALVDELLLAPNPLDDENMRLRAAITEWAEATQALNDIDSAWDNAIYAGEDAGIYVSVWTSALARVRDAEANLRRLAEGEKP